MTGKGYFSRLESKFTFMYTIILIVVITCIACSIGQYSNSILKKKSLDSCIQKLDFAGERFEQILDRIENESLLLTLNQAARYEAAPSFIRTTTGRSPLSKSRCPRRSGRNSSIPPKNLSGISTSPRPRIQEAI